MAIRKKLHANSIPDEKFKEAIQWLEEGKTKKGACEILGVASNSTMERLIEEWKDNQRVSAEMRKKKRGTKIEGAELANVIDSYLSGDSFEAIAERFYRSANMIRMVLSAHGALLRVNGEVDPLFPPAIPEESMKEVFEVGEHVWIPGYQCIGEIKKALDNPVGAYRIYLLSESKQQYVNYMYWDIASVKHLEALGVDIKALGFKWGKEDVAELVNNAVKAALKLEKRGKGE
uniref:Helicase n=3 Tax=unclassified bacterial viruses TaxID=12333 RepID=A0AAU8EDB8_9VIRU